MNLFYVTADINACVQHAAIAHKGFVEYWLVRSLGDQRQIIDLAFKMIN